MRAQLKIFAGPSGYPVTGPIYLTECNNQLIPGKAYTDKTSKTADLSHLPHHLLKGKYDDEAEKH